MRRVIGVGSALTLLVFIAALVVLLIPQSCSPAAPGSRFYLCIPLNLVEGLLLALLAAALATVIGFAAFLHGLINKGQKTPPVRAGDDWSRWLDSTSALKAQYQHAYDVHVPSLSHQAATASPRPAT
jgi:hypothetical protein